ncbi:uncharacterized protein DS421_1g00450 [Arachis hypogaea]|nr:uncharacterized protein DS421_1g00450 [Arachis hypogaea]
MASVDLSQWVDVTVLGEEPLVDTEFITHLRTRHRICTSEEDEPKYELVVPGPEDRVCFGRDSEEVPHFFYMYESMITRLDMARKNAQESYQRVQKAKARSRARTGGTRAIVSPPPPPPQNVGASSQPIVISSSALSRPLPSARLFSEPEKKKCKTLESGSSFDGGVKADALAFVRKNIYPHISVDDVSVRNHLTTLAEESFRAAGVCGKLLDIFEKTPLSSLGLTSKVEELEGRLLAYQEHERELKEEVAKLKEERDTLQEKENLVSVRKDLLNSRSAYAELEDSIADGAEEAWRIFKEQVGVIAPDLDLSPLDPDKVVIDGAIVDPPAPDASSSSVVPPTSSSSPVVASLPDPGGALPDSGGGDLSTLL